MLIVVICLCSSWPQLVIKSTSQIIPTGLAVISTGEQFILLSNVSLDILGLTKSVFSTACCYSFHEFGTVFIIASVKRDRLSCIDDLLVERIRTQGKGFR